MSTCVSDKGEFSSHDLVGEGTERHCEKCGYNPWLYGDTDENGVAVTSRVPDIFVNGVEVDAPARITQGDWNELCLQVSEIHMFIEELKTAMIPMIEQMKSGGLMGMLMGRKGK